MLGLCPDLLGGLGHTVPLGSSFLAGHVYCTHQLVQSRSLSQVGAHSSSPWAASQKGGLQLCSQRSPLGRASEQGRASLGDATDQITQASVRGSSCRAASPSRMRRPPILQALLSLWDPALATLTWTSTTSFWVGSTFLHNRYPPSFCLYNRVMEATCLRQH